MKIKNKSDIKFCCELMKEKYIERNLFSFGSMTGVHFNLYSESNEPFLEKMNYCPFCGAEMLVVFDINWKNS